MKRIAIFFVAALVVTSLFVGVALPTKAQTTFRVGLVTDVGEVDDRSFNQSAWEGAQAGAKAVGGEAEYVETKDPNDYAANIALFADQEYNVIVTVGFALGDATLAAAKQYPNVRFIGVDQFQAAETPGVTGIIFPEAKSGFLAGVLAARMTKSNVIAAVLGTDQVPPVVAFKEGYETGAYWAAGNGDVEAGKAKLKIISTYHPGGLAVAFIDPAWGAQTAAQAIDQGADVIFGAGGKTGNGALEEVAKQTSADKVLYCIGVDTDQWLSVPAAQPCLISSAMKLITDAVSELIVQTNEGTIKDGNFLGDVGLAPFYDFDSNVPQAVKDELAMVKEMLLSDELDPLTGKAPVAPEATPEATAEATPGN